jgi:hypothetical protein
VKRSWETIADNLKKRGWSLGYVSAIDSNGRTIWIADAHQGDEKRCLEKERERRKKDARAPTQCVHSFYELSPPQETTHTLILNPKASEESSMKNPDRFNAFLSRVA